MRLEMYEINPNLSVDHQFELQHPATENPIPQNHQVNSFKYEYDQIAFKEEKKKEEKRKFKTPMNSRWVFNVRLGDSFSMPMHFLYINQQEKQRKSIQIKKNIQANININTTADWY